MIDLHLHLDGSLSKEDFIFLAKKDNVSLGEDFPNNIYVPENCTSLEQYLERFALPCSLMQTRANIAYTVKSLIDRLYDLGYIYAEIRFAPLLHLEKGLDEKEVISAAILGLEEGLKNKKDFDANLILCLMRQVEDEVNFKTIETMRELSHPKVVALDLAGPEAFKKTSLYAPLFNKAKEYGLNVIIHAGEACGNESILEAKELGAKRIGHGVHLNLDKENIEKVKDLTFEFCPTSNIQTKSILSYKDNPLRKFINLGLKVTINADNMTVSNTNVLKEFRHMYQTFNLSKEEIFALLNNSLDASFASSETKKELKKVLKNRFNDFYLSIING